MNATILEPVQRDFDHQFGEGTEAALTFITAGRTKPAFQSAAYTGGAPRLFFPTERHTVHIRNLRPVTSSLSLDRQGFELHRHASSIADFHDDAGIKARYYPELEALLADVLGARRVVIFDATRRSDAAGKAAAMRGPADRVHVDYTTKSGPQRLRDVLGDAEAARLERAGTHIIQVNVWRPIRGPVQRSPLALADASSVRSEDLVATDQIFPNRVGEIYHLAYEASQRWYYAPEMNVDEVLLIKGWDSLDDGRARFTPHGAFAWSGTPHDAPARESIEVRTFVLL